MIANWRVEGRLSLKYLNVGARMEKGRQASIEVHGQ